MGLDMYLMRKNPDSESETLIYWRKANAIHKWFLDNGRELTDDGRLVEPDGDFNCGKIPVDREMLERLRDEAEYIISNPKKANRSMPTCPGFFFGSVDYDDGYFQDLQDTVDGINRVIRDTSIKWGDLKNDEIGDVYYTCWW